MLDGDRPEHHAFGADVDALLGLDRGLDAVRPAPVVGHPPGELVDELDTAAAHDVVAVAQEQHRRVQGDVDRGERHVLGRVMERAAPERRLRVAEPGVGERDVPLVLVDAVVDAGLQRADRSGDCGWGTGGAAASPAITSGTRASSIRMKSASSTMA